MILVNFSHPLSEAQQRRLEVLAGEPLLRTVAVLPEFDEQAPFAPQAEALLAQAGLTSSEWQTGVIVVLLPSLNYIAALLLAQLHGRMGYFPTIIRLRPVAGASPRRFEVAELLDLQDARAAGRRRRDEQR